MCNQINFNKENDDVSFTNLMYFQWQKYVSPVPKKHRLLHVYYLHVD